MKKILGILIAIIMLSSISFAKNGIDYNIKLGLNHTTVSGQPGSSPATNFAAGFGVDYKLSQDSSVLVDLLYSAEGVNAKYTDSRIEYSSDLSLSYLKLPVLYNYKLNKDWSVFGGAYLALLLNAKTKLTTTTATASSTESTDVINLCNNFDYGLVLGGSYTIQDFTIDLRYNLGLGSIDKRGTLQHRAIALGIGYKLPL